MEWLFLLGFILFCILLAIGIGKLTYKSNKHNTSHIYYYTGKPDRKYKTFR